MKLTYGNLVRGSFLLLFLISSIQCLAKPGEQSGLIAILSLIGFVCFDVVCNFKRPKYKDFSNEIQQLEDKNKQLEEQFQQIKGDISIVKIGATINRSNVR